ncbi:hypothetical protein E8E11_008758 [Didymella keratinophila]|nr:hypothetical protein E8E11_008758 [Didymella keratinophila]
MSSHLPHRFSIRDARLADESFITTAFDASLPYLSSIGSKSQWGEMPFTQRPGWVEETGQQIRDSERNAEEDAREGLRIFVLDAEMRGEEMEEMEEMEIDKIEMKSLDRLGEMEGRWRVPVGFAFVRGGWMPRYLPAATVARAGNTDLEDCLYVEVMVSDARVKDLVRGVGAALLDGVRKYGRKRGKKVIYMDGWAGNGGKLIRYYEEQGFEIVAEFSLPRKNKEPWVGSLMKIDI